MRGSGATLSAMETSACLLAPTPRAGAPCKKRQSVLWTPHEVKRTATNALSTAGMLLFPHRTLIRTRRIYGT